MLACCSSRHAPPDGAPTGTRSIYGDEVNLAFKLGEDVARGREVLLTEDAYGKLTADGEAIDATACSVEIGGVPLRYYRLTRSA